jgi:biopolymer transport protein ExbD
MPPSPLQRRLVLSGNVVNETELKASREAAQKENPETLVVVQADEGVTHGKVVEVMELGQERRARPAGHRRSRAPE